MTRVKKNRSLKRIHSVKTGSISKLKKAAGVDRQVGKRVKGRRTLSAYEKFLLENPDASEAAKAAQKAAEKSGSGQSCRCSGGKPPTRWKKTLTAVTDNGLNDQNRCWISSTTKTSAISTDATLGSHRPAARMLAATALNIARPWDAADELLLNSGEAPDLLINDRYGALQCVFPAATAWADSASAQTATERNLQANQRQQSGVVIWQEDDLPPTATLVFIKVPKQFELLQFWLQQCQQRLPANTRYVLSGMVKHWPVNWLQWLEQYASSYQQSQVQKKARLVEITLSQPLPEQSLWRGYTSQNELRFEALPGVFAREQLDIGSRVLLDLPDPGYGGVLCDLGCGNGLLGLTLAHRYRIERLMLTDNSFSGRAFGPA